MTDPVNDTTVRGNRSSASVSVKKGDDACRLCKYSVSVSDLSCQSAKRDAATMQLDRREMKEASVRKALRSAVVGLMGEGCD